VSFNFSGIMLGFHVFLEVFMNVSQAPQSLVHGVLSSANYPSLENLEVWSESILKAQKRIQKYLTPSPLKFSPWLASLTQSDVWLKLECLNPNGSFKVRGALNAIGKLVEERGSCKVVCASAGNHAQGVAFAAKHLNCEAHIFLPVQTPLVKREACEALGAKIYLGGEALNESMELALQFAETTKAFFIHPFNNFDVVCGQATLFFESILQWNEQHLLNTKSLDNFLCCVGGGGLISGVGIASLIYKQTEKKEITVLGAQQEVFNSAYVSLQNKQWLPFTGGAHSHSIADGIAVKKIGNLNYDAIVNSVKRIFVASDNEIVGSILGLCEKEHVVVEGGGAVGVACLQKYKSFFEEKSTIVTVSGGNIDPQLLSRIIMQGLGVTGRTLKISVCVHDRPGTLRELLDKIAFLEANVLEVHHDRTYTQVHVGQVNVEVSLETKTFEHQYQILESLAEFGYQPKVKTS
jgi:threonine dehydratase